jgi:serine/threonine-protein kinase
MQGGINEFANVPQPGEVLLGKYRIERVLGVGGMGVVVEARHLQLEDRVAIKFLHASMVHNEEVVTRFVREGRAATKIRSEHVVRVFDVGTLEGGAPYMVMEFLEGSDLAQIVERRGPLPLAQSVDWLLQACEAIAEAHAAGIVHRDLKPANLFLIARSDESDCIKVLDFGISKVNGVGEDHLGMTKTQAVMGSPRYMSPEQLRSSRGVDARSDIWALGTVLHEMLTGTPPFNADTMPELCARILTEAPPPLLPQRTDLPRELEVALLGAFQKDPAMRYQNVWQLAAALAPFGTPAAQLSANRVARVLKLVPGGFGTSDPYVRSSGIPISMPPPALGVRGTAGPWAGSQPEMRPPARKNWIAAVAAAVVVLCIVVGVGAIALSRRSSPSASTGNVPQPPVLSSAPIVLPPADEPSAAASSADTAAPPVESPSAAPGASAVAPGTTVPPGRARPFLPPAPKPVPPKPKTTTNPFDDR